MRRILPLVALPFLAHLAATACTASSRRALSGSSSPAASGSGTTGAGGMATASGSGGSTLSFMNGSGGSSAGCMPLHCSGDLHSVLDCNGELVMTCPPTQGCSAGGCIDACQAAVAGKTSIGCEYYAHNPLTLFGRGCHALFVANTWNAPISISGEAKGQTIDLGKYAYLPQGSGENLTLSPLNGKLAAGKVAIVFLRDGPGFMQGIKCPEPAAETDPAASAWTDGVSGTGNTGVALRVTVTAPVIVYDINPYGGGQSEITSASLLLPTSTWDDNYIAITPRPIGTNTLNPAIAIVASMDGTQVTLLPTAQVQAGNGVSGGPANQPEMYTLDRGQVLRFEQHDDLLGSVVSANHPIGLWGEQQCINIDQFACDAAHQQIPPVRALGSEYVWVRYRDRVDGANETPPTRITGAVDGTQLSWLPSPPMGAQMTVGRGESFEVRSSTPFVVKSQDDKHPFYVAAYMTGGAAFMNGRGDPEFVNVIPAAQYVNDYLFFTDATYPETDLVFIRKAGPNGFADVKLDCVGNIGGWQPVGDGKTYQYARFDVSTGNFQGVGKCNNGTNHASSKLPFALTVWGWGTEVTGMSQQKGYSQWVSYAYPAGASVQSINTVIVPPNPK